MLVFDIFYQAELDQQYANMLAFSLILLFILIVLCKIFAMIRKYGHSTESGLILATAFMNSGNYGASIILFAYGETAFTCAISLMVLHAILMNFCDIYYAARGNGSSKTVFKISPPIAFEIIMPIPIEPVLAKVLVLVAAMPSAANAVMYAVQYDTEPDLVSSIRLITIIISIFTDTLMLILLG